MISEKTVLGMQGEAVMCDRADDWEIPTVLEIEERRSLCKMRYRLARHL